jgi:hypothetical protein
VQKTWRGPVCAEKHTQASTIAVQGRGKLAFGRKGKRQRNSCCVVQNRQNAYKAFGVWSALLSARSRPYRRYAVSDDSRSQSDSHTERLVRWGECAAGESPAPCEREQPAVPVHASTSERGEPPPHWKAHSRLRSQLISQSRDVQQCLQLTALLLSASRSRKEVSPPPENFLDERGSIHKASVACFGVAERRP